MPARSQTENSRDQSYGIAERNNEIAAQSVQKDISEHVEVQEQDEVLSPQTSRCLSRQTSLGHSLAGPYRRSSFVATGVSHPTFVPGVQNREPGYLSKAEQEAVRDEERSLLRDNRILPPKHPRRSSATSSKSRKSGLTSSLKRRSRQDEEATIESSNEEPHSVNEITPLFSGANANGPEQDGIAPDQLDKQWDDAVIAGNVKTTWQREAKVLGRYSRSLILTFFLQYSLTVASVFTVGHLGTIELGAVSLGSMTASITGYAILQGLATSLDTLSAQAYGAGNKKLVGVQTQRMILFLWVVLIPIGIIWLLGGRILAHIVPETRTAELAGLYLKIALIGAPGYAAFQAMERYVQAQGLFTANLYVLLIVAPLNAFLHWLLVWHFNMGFIGAPTAVAITETLMPFLLGAYIYFIDGMECWGGLSSAAFKNWWPMIRLALPGFAMVVAEYLAFEILTFGASWISPEHLAAQSVLSTIIILFYNLPFPISIAASTRIANLIGAGLPDAARMSAKVTLIVATFAGLFNATILSSLRLYIPRLFTNDEQVVDIVAKLLPLCAGFQLVDALAANCNGILRGIGRQEIGGYVSLAAYYGVAMPISFGTGFGLEWGLYGLWAGPAVALFM